MEFMVRILLEEYEKWRLKINLEKNILHGLWSRNQNVIMKDQKGCISGCEEFEFLGITIDKRGQNSINNRINKCRAITAMLNGVL